ncbi:MAG: transcription-repair coupling factor [Deltaproteobacteria bacterium]|nr:transcription-repair coupling factor [Deltaproteobacteria bacterium]
MSSNLGLQILRKWGENGHPPIRVSGLNPAASAHLLSRILSASNHRVVVVCPTLDAAMKFHQDLKTFFQLEAPGNQPLHLSRNLIGGLDFFPGWDQSPYLAFNPSQKNRIRRLRTLWRMMMGELRCVVTDVESLAQRCPSRESLLLRSIELKPGGFFERGALVTRLEEAGYRMADPVEDPGAYAVRGNLVDVFTPWGKKPVRLEFFGDELETIRAFDPVSQRSEPDPLPAANVIPVADWPFTPDAVARAKTASKAFCDEFGIPKKVRDAFSETLDLGGRDPLLDYLSPFFTSEMDSWLLQHAAEDAAENPGETPAAAWKIATLDALSIDTGYERLVAELKADFERALKEGRIAAPWDRLFVPPETLHATIKKNLALSLDALEIATPDAAAPRESAPSTDFDASDDASSAVTPSIDEAGRSRVRLIRNDDLRPPAKSDSLESFYQKAALWAARGWSRVVIASTTSQSDRIRYLLEQHGIAARVVSTVDWSGRSVLQIADGILSAGFRIPAENLAVVTDSEVFGPKKTRTHHSQKEDLPYVGMGTFVSSLDEINGGDLVVHGRHGIGRYQGLVKLEIDGIPQDFLLLQYAGTDRLYLPVYRLDQVQRYVGAEHGSSAPLDKLGAGAFEKTKEKVKAELQDLANHLLRLYAKRASRQGFAYSPVDEHYRGFEARFPFAETPDQLKAIDDALADMESPKIMDRLICGDVGYGKTEVAMRAAFKAVMDGKQVAVLVPTTILALQHERSFRERFRDTPVRIGTLSRFKTAKEIRETLEALKAGGVDIAIGTHRLLSRDVAFKDVGLIIVDEEQRFGVEHKERLKALKVNTDVLTLTATPIPRTLQMSMMGLRDISVINTAPVDRLSVRTYAARFDEEIIRRAIRQEIARGGQTFFLHNRVQSIGAMADRLRAIVPEARLIVAHGQLDERELEAKMLGFFNREADVLLCSSIIESGLDIPSANTMIINRADMFGLSQLYQLRGRVGRSRQRAYCYLLLPEEGAITDDAKKRLEVIQRFVDLGSGFKVASHDLELRGGGDLLGKAQSGQIAAIGYEMFTELLDEAIRGLKGQPIEDHFDPEIKIPVPTLLPETYVPDIHQRLGLYKRLSDAQHADALHALELEMQDRFGKPPEEAQNLLWLIRIKQLLRGHHVKSLVCGKARVSLEAGDATKLSPARVMTLVQKQPHQYALTPDSKILIKWKFDSPQRLFHETQKFLSMVVER